MCVLYRWSHSWTCRAEIWYGGPHLPWEVIGYIFSSTSTSRVASPAWSQGSFSWNTHSGRATLYFSVSYPGPQGQVFLKCGTGVHAAQTASGLPKFGCHSGHGLCSGLELCSRLKNFRVAENAVDKARNLCKCIDSDWHANISRWWSSISFTPSLWWSLDTPNSFLSSASWNPA